MRYINVSNIINIIYYQYYLILSNIITTHINPFLNHGGGWISDETKLDDPMGNIEFLDQRKRELSETDPVGSSNAAAWVDQQQNILAAGTPLLQGCVVWHDTINQLINHLKKEVNIIDWLFIRNKIFFIFCNLWIFVVDKTFYFIGQNASIKYAEWIFIFNLCDIFIFL